MAPQVLFIHNEHMATEALSRRNHRVGDRAWPNFRCMAMTFAFRSMVFRELHGGPRLPLDDFRVVDRDSFH
jgi:hypothetical protein